MMDHPPNPPPVDDLNDDNEFDWYRQRAEADKTSEQSFESFDGEWLIRAGTLKGMGRASHISLGRDFY